MAFLLKGLQPVGATSAGGDEGETPGDNSISIWQYSSTDTLATIQTAGYFNQVRDLLNADDILWIYATGDNLRVTFFSSANKSPATSNVTVSSKGNTAA